MIAECGMRNAECGLFSRRSRYVLSFRIPQSAFRNGISLMEVLISMFVMLFGLMGVAAIFPVGNYYVVEGEKHDLGSLLAANAFEELQTRGMLRPEVWLYAGNPPGQKGVDPTVPNPEYPLNNPKFIQDSFGTDPGFANIIDPIVHPGHAFVIDPMSVANAITPTNLDVWSLLLPDGSANIVNPWFINNPPPNVISLPGERWPVRRLTLPVPDPTGSVAFLPMSGSVAETIFRLRDDLAVEMPERDDAPSIQRWSTADLNSPPTPDDPTDDTLLSRQYQGNFSWLATVVPSTREALIGLQPASLGTYLYEVSVVVFYKRVPTPAAETERLLRAELLTGGELVMYGDSIDEVDKGLEGIKSGAWVAVMGVNQTTGAFMLKWYRLLALDEETYSDNVVSVGSTFPLRRAMLLGPDWHALPGTTVVANLRVAILPGIASVVTREMVLERDSMWNAE